jgi:outer membrane immunogenic protein
MKKVFIAFMVVIAFATGVKAQDAAAEKPKLLNIGTGISNWGIPIVGSMDFTAIKNLTIGFGASYQTKKIVRGFGWSDWRLTLLGIRLQANYHFGALLEVDPKVDLYAGVAVAAYLQLLRNMDNPNGFVSGEDASFKRAFTKGYAGPGVCAQIGMHYFFSAKAGLHLELALGTVVSSATVGITIRL